LKNSRIGFSPGGYFCIIKLAHWIFDGGKIMSTQYIYWSLLKHKDWQLYLAATEKGLCFVGSQGKGLEEVSLWAEKRMQGSTLVENKEKLKPYSEELIEYFDGKRTSFTIVSDYHGTEFQRAVWGALCEIPFGETKTYSDIAAQINRPTAVRAVGAAIGANPVMITVPCHRVLGKDGKLTGFRGGLEMKTRLLELERKA
jgi:methylated-DNA-[protein]-cysteine S-methyltransferase